MSRFFRTYEQAIDFLFGRINYERTAGIAYSSDDLKLERMDRLLAHLGRPQEQIQVVHVAGTKGKGSTSVMAAEILSAAGYRTGLFTSPHVSVFEERMVIDGVPPVPEHFIELVNRVIEPVDQMDRLSDGRGPTYFELATAVAWLYFLECGAEIAVLEVGLGGRLDATNVCHPLVGVITNISRDHTNVLGSSLAQIAREKAGIIKPGVPVVSGVAPGPAGDVVEEVCRLNGSQLIRLGCEVQWRPSEGAPCSNGNEVVSSADAALNYPLLIDVEVPGAQWRRVPVPLRGTHQASNAALAIASVSLLSQRGWRIAPEAVCAGLSAVRWPARIELLASSPTVIVDAAHNWASAAALAQTLQTQFSARRRILIFAATQEKDVGGMLRLLLPRFDTVILTQYQTNPRCVSIHDLSALAQATTLQPFHIAFDASAAWRLARHLAGPDDLICITGSFFIAAELRDIILDGQKDAHHRAPITPAFIVAEGVNRPDNDPSVRTSDTSSAGSQATAVDLLRTKSLK